MDLMNGSSARADTSTDQVQAKARGSVWIPVWALTGGQGAKDAPPPLGFRRRWRAKSGTLPHPTLKIDLARCPPFDVDRRPETVDALRTPSRASENVRLRPVVDVASFAVVDSGGIRPS